MARPLHRVHQDDRIHEGKAGVAAPVPALEAVALVGRQYSPAGRALVPGLTGGGLDMGRGGHRRGGWRLGLAEYGSDLGLGEGLGRDVGRVHLGDPGDCRGARAPDVDEL